MPCATGYIGTCSTPKTTTTYDALNRPLTITDGGNGTVNYTYNQNDAFVTIGPAPSGENPKRRQLEYDALGRLTSVSFRQACMNFPEAVGIVGCPLNCGRRITDENQENNHFRQSL